MIIIVKLPASVMQLEFRIDFARKRCNMPMLRPHFLIKTADCGQKEKLKTTAKTKSN